jgi:hypothetical protein
MLGAPQGERSEHIPEQFKAHGLNKFAKQGRAFPSHLKSLQTSHQEMEA